MSTLPSGIVIAGPTGAGKTELALRLADHLIAAGRSAEIVSADAVSILRELEIGTAKPSNEDRRRIRHHLIDIRSIADPSYSAGEFSRDFSEILPELPAPAIVVGGSGFYIDAIIRGLADLPRAQPEIRERLTAEEASRPGALYERLRRLDPNAADKIGPANRHRLIRALEVCEITGGRFSEHARRPPEFRPLIVVLSPARDDLYRAIDDRTRLMFERGLPEEVEELLRKFPADLPAFSIIGYAESLKLVRGEIGRTEAIEQTARRTRHLAKRQLTWWRNFRYEQMCFDRPAISAADVMSKWKERVSCADS